MWRVASRLFPLLPVAVYGLQRGDNWRLLRAQDHSFGSVTYAANSPIEDRIRVRRLSDANATLACVFDGHGGWQISHYLNEHVTDAFTKAYEKAAGDTRKRAEAALKTAFDDMEREIVEMAKEPYHIGFGEVASTGSCAITAVVFSNFYAVANTGDCQAVLISRTSTGCTGKNLCPVHSSNEPKEQSRLKTEHPGESDIVVCRHPKACYVKQRLMPTRSFGDLDLKWPEFNNPQELPREQGYRSPKKPFTPPYITHKPDVIVGEIRPEDKFLILASDGLWDELSEQTVANVVAGTNDPTEAANLLLEAALANAAKNAGMTVFQLKEVTHGRRRLHDDISIAVVQLRPNP